MLKESRQVRRARERAEAKAKLKAEKVVINNIDGFLPDAGQNWHPDGYGWFQISELIQTMYDNPKLLMEYRNGVNYGRLNVPVDIMDKEGKHQLMPKQSRGYFATFRFTADRLNQLADAIDLGGMSVRIGGKVAETLASPIGESYTVIDVNDIWSRGNISGNMLFCVYVTDKMLKLDSREFAKMIRDYAKAVAQ